MDPIPAQEFTKEIIGGILQDHGTTLAAYLTTMASSALISYNREHSRGVDRTVTGCMGKVFTALLTAFPVLYWMNSPETKPSVGLEATVVHGVDQIMTGAFLSGVTQLVRSVKMRKVH